MKQGLDLDTIAKAFPHVEYRQDIFPGLAFRLKRPKTCTLLFRTGRMVCTGAKKEEEVYEATEKLRLALEEIGVPYEEKPTRDLSTRLLNKRLV